MNREECKDNNREQSPLIQNIVDTMDIFLGERSWNNLTMVLEAVRNAMNEGEKTCNSYRNTNGCIRTG